MIILIMLINSWFAKTKELQFIFPCMALGCQASRLLNTANQYVIMSDCCMIALYYYNGTMLQD